MATRSTWTGHLSFGLVSVPIQLFAAAREERIDLHMMHELCGSGVKQKYVCESCGEEVPRTGGARFYAWDKTTKVVLTPSELSRADPPTSKVSTVLEFVEQGDIDPIQMGASFYVAPGDGGQHAFALLAAAMEDRGVGAIAKITMSGREHTVLFRPISGRKMMMHLLFYADEVRVPDRVPDLTSEKISEQEMNLAKMLVEGMLSEFDIKKYQDDRRVKLMKMIEAKHEGRAEEDNVVEMPAKSTPDLLAALKASILDKGKKRA